MFYSRKLGTAEDNVVKSRRLRSAEHADGVGDTRSAENFGQTP
jgi:hypothetical protein